MSKTNLLRARRWLDKNRPQILALVAADADSTPREPSTFMAEWPGLWDTREWKWYLSQEPTPKQT